MKSVLDRILDGEDIRVVISESVFANDSFGYSLDTTLYYEFGDALKEIITDRNTDEGFYEYYFDGSEESLSEFSKKVKRLQRKFPDYSFDGNVVERFDGELRYLLKIKLNRIH